MNRHVNKNKMVKLDDPNIRVEDVDNMPAEVATGLLCETKLSNTMRKRCMDARSKHYVSTREAKPIEVRTANRLKSATWHQLVKWVSRATKREKVVLGVLRTLNERLDALANMIDQKDPIVVRQKAILERAIKAYMFKGSALQQGIECLDDEIKRRMNFIQGLNKVAPTVAKGMLDAMQRGE